MQLVTPETGRNYGPLHEGVMHDNAPRMLTLAWVSITMATDTMGLAMGTPGALLNAGVPICAVNIPPGRNRTYSLEYQRAIGLDRLLASFPNVVQVPVAAAFEIAGCEARCSSYFCCSRRAPLQARSRLPGTP